jgi:hypothetical protein
VTKKVVQRATQLVKDLDLEYPAPTKNVHLEPPRADMQGIDIISCAVLQGGLILARESEAQFRSNPLFSDFEQLVGLLRQ